MYTKIKQKLRQETVLIIAVLLAIFSAFIIHPDALYPGYIDFRTLAILFSLMTVMAGLQRQNVFDHIGQVLLKRTKNTSGLLFVLVGLCFFCSMLITNDVSLITFVPFAFIVLHGLGDKAFRQLAIPVVCMQTIAANLGSMLTPIGNPQNLYLYGKSGMSMGAFLRLMLPYTLISLLLLTAWILFLCRKMNFSDSQSTFLPEDSAVHPMNRSRILMYTALFAVCLMTVVRILPYPVMLLTVLLAVLITDRHTLRQVDYSLLLTFAAFFVFIGNLGRIPAFSEWIQSIIAGHEVSVAILASQITSNVPAALLLSGFTSDVQALIISTNLGGLGTLIASMASLISYRQIATRMPDRKGAYFAAFTISNVLFLAVLTGIWILIR